jgi:four helix bundle protein
VSIAANVAEGFKRSGRTEKARFFNIAQASLEETRYYLILANDLAYTETKSLMALLDEVGRLLGGYLRALKPPPPSS